MYNIGDKVWYASFGTREEKVPCPVCYGNKKVIVILGNQDEVEVECDYCKKGWMGAQGYVIEYLQLPKVEPHTITGRRVEEGIDGEKVEYHDGNSYLYSDNIFDTKEEALDCATQLVEEHNKKEEVKIKHKNEKSYTWNAGYHLKAAKDKYKEAQYHEERARICKSKSKEK